MAYESIKIRIANLGFCCPYAYFEATKWDKAGKVARELDCSPASVRIWRKKEPQCRALLGCFADITPESAQPRGTDHDHASSEFDFPLCGHDDGNP